MAAQLILTNVGMLSSSVTKIPEQVEAWEEQNDEKIVKLLRWEDFFFPGVKLQLDSAALCRTRRDLELPNLPGRDKPSSGLA